MRKIVSYALTSLVVLALTGCPWDSGPTLPATTTGGGWFITTLFFALNGPMALLAPETSVNGTWKSDGQNAAGSASPFGVTTDTVAATAAVPNGRVPATWQLVSSWSDPQCDGVTALATPSYPEVTEDFICYESSVEAMNSAFVVNPNPIYLSNLPSQITITGSGFSSTYGMPVVQYYSLQGTLIASTTVSYVSPDGSTISTPTPNLSQVPPAAYAGIISNVGPSGALIYAGAASVIVMNRPVVATPLETNCVVTLNGGVPPSGITYTLTVTDATPGATIYYTINETNGVINGTTTSGGQIQITVPTNTSLSGTMYATYPGDDTSSTSYLSF